MEHPGAHLHQQGRRADARPHRAHGAGRALALHPHGHLPLGLFAHPARECRAHRLHRVIHHLRHVGQPQPVEDHRPRAQPPRRALQARRGGLAHLAGQEQAHHPGGLSGQRLLCRRGPSGADARVRQHLQPLLPALQAQRRYGFRRPAAADQHPAARLPRRAGALPGALPVHPGRRVPGHQLRAVCHHPPPLAAPLEGLRRGRRRAVHLLVPRRQNREHPLVPQRLSHGTGLQARAELPLDAHHRRCGQLGHRPQRQAHGEALLLGGRRGGENPHPEGLYRP